MYSVNINSIRDYGILNCTCRHISITCGYRRGVISGFNDKQVFILLKQLLYNIDWYMVAPSLHKYSKYVFERDTQLLIISRRCIELLTVHFFVRLFDGIPAKTLLSLVHDDYAKQ